MTCKRRSALLPLVLCCLALCLCPARAAQSAGTEEELAIAQQLAQDEAARAVPSVPPAAGALGLAVLLVFGAITSRKHRVQEEAGYDPILDDRRIGDPYSRLAGREKRRRR